MAFGLREFLKTSRYRSATVSDSHGLPHIRQLKGNIYVAVMYSVYNKFS